MRSPLALPAFRFLPRVLCAVFLLGSSFGAVASPSLPQERAPSLDAVKRMVRGKRWPQAIKALVQLTEKHPDSGEAWFYLAYSYHNAGELAKALEIGPKVVAAPRYRATGLYNMACAHSVLGQTDQAAKRLDEAMTAGFLDIDLLETDPELANLRAKLTLPAPSTHEYTDHRGPARIVVPYRVLLPEGYDPEKTYSVAFSFGPGAGGKRSTDWSIDNLWSEASTREDWIVVCAVAPKNGWINHPSHHALESLLKRLRKDYKVAGNTFHFVGFGGGARPARTYSSMSKKYVASLTVASASCFEGWDDSDYRRTKQLAVHQVVGAKAGYLHTSSVAAHANLKSYASSAQLSLLENDGALLESLHGGKLLDLVAKTLPAPKD